MSTPYDAPSPYDAAIPYDGATAVAPFWTDQMGGGRPTDAMGVPGRLPNHTAVQTGPVALTPPPPGPSGGAFWPSPSGAGRSTGAKSDPGRLPNV